MRETRIGRPTVQRQTIILVLLMMMISVLFNPTKKKEKRKKQRANNNKKSLRAKILGKRRCEYETMPHRPILWLSKNTIVINDSEDSKQIAISAHIFLALRSIYALACSSHHIAFGPMSPLYCRRWEKVSDNVKMTTTNQIGCHWTSGTVHLLFKVFKTDGLYIAKK